jgi:hypothetical protein
LMLDLSQIYQEVLINEENSLCFYVCILLYDIYNGAGEVILWEGVK